MAVAQAGTFKRGLANFFGGVAYIVLILQWLLVVLAYFYWIQTLPFFPQQGSEPTPSTPPPITPPQEDGFGAPIILGAVITVAMIVLSIYAFIKLPSMVVKSSKKIVHSTAEWTAPAALHAQHKKDTKKNRKKITPKIVIILKIIVTAIAFGLICCSQFLPEQKLAFNVIFTSGAWLAGLTVAFFGLQYLVAKLLRIEANQLW